MITIWHQTTDSNDALFYNSGLIPVAIVPTNSNSLSLAANINRQQLESKSFGQCSHTIVTPHRHTSVDDILFD